MPGLPNANQAFIDPHKITEYLLNHAHPRGGPKAVFLERFGFSVAHWEQLQDALLAHAATNPVDRTNMTDFGAIYQILGPLRSPDGRNPSVLVVWVIRIGEDFPRLVTAVPA